jgi:hypothetical protein
VTSNGELIGKQLVGLDGAMREKKMIVVFFSRSPFLSPRLHKTPFNILSALINLLFIV